MERANRQPERNRFASGNPYYTFDLSDGMRTVRVFSFGGDPGPRLRALYGSPDAVIAEPAGCRREYWWYQRAGMVVTPDERVVQGEAEVALIVLSPDASLIEVRRLLNLPTAVPH